MRIFIKVTLRPQRNAEVQKEHHAEIAQERGADIEAHAFTHVRNDGARGIEIPKEFRLVSNNGCEWIFNFTNQQSPYSPILTQTNRIVLPEEAKRAD